MGRFLCATHTQIPGEKREIPVHAEIPVETRYIASLRGFQAG